MVLQKRNVITIGEFDGVHLGHQALIGRVREHAEVRNIGSAVVTFDKHPAMVLRPDSAPKLLMDLDEKIEVLGSLGIDLTLVIHFDHARANESAEHFVNSVIIDRLCADLVVVGNDFRFGRGREGDVAMLMELGKKRGFSVEEFAPVASEESIVSSTRIRQAVERGDVGLAGRLLGRPHEVHGVVVMGDGRGRELGFPTANVHVPKSICVPADGVYVGEYVFSSGERKLAAISVGTRPTFYEEGINLVEAYVLDFEGDLYGQRAGLRFYQQLRPQQKFGHIGQLITQMNKDVSATRAYFHEAAPQSNSLE